MSTRNAVILVVAIFAALAVLVALSHAGSGTSDTITLNASGGASIDVTYSVGDKNSQNTSAASPWQVSYRSTSGIPTVSMVVQNGGGGSNTVSCSITEDGHTVSSNTSYGPYAVVQCSH